MQELFNIRRTFFEENYHCAFHLDKIFDVHFGENSLNADIAIAVLEYTPQKNGK